MRYIRTAHGRAAEVDLGDKRRREAVLEAGAARHALEVRGGKAMIPEGVASQGPRPQGPIEHHECALRHGDRIWCVCFVSDSPQHALEARHRWPRT